MMVFTPGWVLLGEHLLETTGTKCHGVSMADLLISFFCIKVYRELTTKDMFHQHLSSGMNACLTDRGLHQQTALQDGFIFLQHSFVPLCCRSSHCPPRIRDGQQPHWHHEHPVQQHRQGPVQNLHAGGTKRAAVPAAETHRRAGVLGAAGHRQPH